MPFKIYQSKCPNDVHQLVVSVSKHLYILKNGQVTYQKKPLEVDLLNCRDSTKDHVVHYLIKDHFSGALYGEVSPSSNLLSLGEFLYRAWSPKEKCSFCGFPQGVILPKTVISVFPGVVNLLDALGIMTRTATSGFHAGIRDVRTWEDYIRYQFCTQNGWAYFKDLQAGAPELSAFISRSYGEGKPRIKLWENNIEEVTVPAVGKEEFLSAYRI